MTYERCSRYLIDGTTANGTRGGEGGEKETAKGHVPPQNGGAPIYYRCVEELKYENISLFPAAVVMAIIRAWTGSLVRGVTADAARRYLLLDVQRSRATAAGRIVTSRPFVREREWERKSLQSWPRYRCSPRRRKSREKSQVRTEDGRPTDNVAFINIRTADGAGGVASRSTIHILRNVNIGPKHISIIPYYGLR